MGRGRPGAGHSPRSAGPCSCFLGDAKTPCAHPVWLRLACREGLCRGRGVCGCGVTCPLCPRTRRSPGRLSCTEEIDPRSAKPSVRQQVCSGLTRPSIRHLPALPGLSGDACLLCLPLPKAAPPSPQPLHPQARGLPSDGAQQGLGNVSFHGEDPGPLNHTRPITGVSRQHTGLASGSWSHRGDAPRLGLKIICTRLQGLHPKAWGHPQARAGGRALEQGVQRGVWKTGPSLVLHLCRDPCPNISDGSPQG